MHCHCRRRSLGTSSVATGCDPVRTRTRARRRSSQTACSWSSPGSHTASISRPSTATKLISRHQNSSEKVARAVHAVRATVAVAMSSPQALALCARLIAIAVALQSGELLWQRRAFGADGIWSWSVLAGDYARAPWLRRPLSIALGDRAFVAVLVVRLLAALAVFFGFAAL